MPHQSIALAWAEGRKHPALFMEMRLGKTLVAIRWASALPAKKILVVCPLAVIPVWEEELSFEGESSVQRLTRAKTCDRFSEATAASSRWFLINYEGLRTCQLLAKLPWGCVILDESTRIRNPRAQITKLCTKSFSKVPAKMVLSGLPAPEGPLDYYPQMEFLEGGFLGCTSFWQFRQRHFSPGFNGWDWTPRPGTSSLVKEEIHRKAFILSRKQAGIGSEKFYQRRVITMSPKQKAEYARVQKDFEAKFSDGTIHLTPWAVVQLTWLHRVAGGFHPDGPALADGKVRETLELLKGELKEESVVIWFRYNNELRAVGDILKKAKIPYGQLHGAVPLPERDKLVKEFQSGERRVLLCQVKVGKFGLNLSRSSTAIYFSNSYDMEDRAQSEERILDPRKSDPLLYIDFVTEDSVDEAVLEILRRKKVNSKFFLAELVRIWREKFSAKKEGAA